MLKRLFQGNKIKLTDNGFQWRRVRYQEPQKLVDAVSKVSNHGPIAVRFRVIRDEVRLFLGLAEDTAETIGSMASSMAFMVDEADPPETLSDTFTLDSTLTGQEDIDAWVVNGSLFVHDESGASTVKPPNEPVEWSLPNPVLGTVVAPEWPSTVTVTETLAWQRPEWFVGRTVNESVHVGAHQIHLSGDTNMTHPWLAALIATRMKHYRNVLLIDGRGDLVEFLYTEGATFDDVHHIDSQTKKGVSINPLEPVMKGSLRHSKLTAEAWLTWFKLIGCPETVFALIQEAAKNESINNLNDLLAWLSTQTGANYTTAIALKNFILPLREDSLGWLFAEENEIKAQIGDRPVWIKAPFNNLKSRKGVYAAAIMAALDVYPDVSIVLHHAPVDIGLMGIQDTQVITVGPDPAWKNGVTQVITKSTEIEVLAGMAMIGHEIPGIGEHIRQLGKYEAIIAKPDESRHHSITKITWREG